jgi:hypothetical protein
MSDKPKPAPKKGKGAGKKSKGADKKAKKAAGDGLTMSVAAHPRAQARIRQAKGWGGLGAFGATAYLSMTHGVSADVAGARAIAAGAAGYVVAWGCSVMVWRQLMVAELRAKVERARAARAVEIEAAAREAEHAAPAQS